ncbi:pyridine nucleotide-disulfide oxidoreductase family protein [Oscillatoria acuminata PCC 6304]|uniref:Pyridine nucleotide-disulfide oxidoreductase family protein n=2 Tax=Oscillatoria acuminata TaxID=118323 RepID=K9TDK5_9CYAN|nr:pyridine nucleotide-disulfide oxidoreductase family protein [Oscillatoria acuminata PCC 6304]
MRCQISAVITLNPATTARIMKDLVLIGGGHSHAIALREFAKSPLPGVRITLISDVLQTPYSGMLPGYLAGFYTFEEAHIDLRPLATLAQAEFYCDRAIGLDLQQNQVLCANRPPIPFDVLSIDIGSTPATLNVPGAATYAIPAKPVPKLLASWNQFREEVLQSPQKSRSLATVGGGAGGVELTLSIQAHLNKILEPKYHKNIEYHLFHRSSHILSSHSPYAARTLTKLMQGMGIHLHLNQTVNRLEKQPSGHLTLDCESGLQIECDRVFWVTQASAPDWISASGLSTDNRGFIQVNDHLQSISHSTIFASGDIATLLNNPRPKAGVFAVRQGKPLFENLCRSLQNKPLIAYHPQQQFLTLIGTGTGKAVASRGRFGLGPFRLIWTWKDWIDRRFMEQFNP